MSVFTQAITARVAARRGESHSNPLPGYSGDLPMERTELPGDWRSLPVYFSRLARYCEERRDEIEVVQFLNLHKWAIPWIYRLRQLGVRTVFTHTMLGEFSSSSWKRTLQRLDRRLLLNLVDRVVVSSSVMAEQLACMGVTSQIEIISNGVDLQRFRPVESHAERLQLRRRLGLDPSWDIILAIGAIHPRKGIDVLIEAFVRLSRVNHHSH